MQKLESTRDVFKDRLFKIPDYQRGYSWQKKQLKDFWEDVVNLPKGRYHYTGLLSLKEVNKQDYKNEKWVNERWLIEDRGFKPFHIVDGQQRLTTIVIFINEIIELLKNLPENEDKQESDIYIGTFSIEQIREDYLLIKKPPEFIINTYKFGYEVDNPSFKYLRHEILGEPNAGKLLETFYTLNLKNSKEFFKTNLLKHYKEYGIEEIEIIFKELTQNLMFNIHEIGDDFDVFIAFETMNNRGKNLSNLELLKNRLIYLTTLYDESELDKDTREVLRNDINDAWKEVYYQLGRNKENPLSDDDFLFAHWIMYFQYKRQKGGEYIRFLLEDKFTPQNVYTKTEVNLSSLTEIVETRDDNQQDEYEEFILEEIAEDEPIMRAELGPSEISDYVKSLKSASVHWYNSFNPYGKNKLTPDEKLWLDRLNRIGIAYFRPLVTVSFIRKDISSKNRVELFKEIERFIFIAFRLGRSFSTFRNSEYYRLTKQLRSGEVDVDYIVSSLRNRIEGWLSAETKLDIQPFKTYISKHYKNGKGYYSWNGLHYFLYEYENEKVLKDGNKKIDWDLFIKTPRDKVSIEHIYPQTADNEYWTNNFKGYSDEEKSLLLGSLGNLLPLSMSKNSSMQNDSFPDKKYGIGESYIGYRDGSHSEIEVAKYEEWNAESILDRGIMLLDFMERRWDIKFENEDSKKEILFLDFSK